MNTLKKFIKLKEENNHPEAFDLKKKVLVKEKKYNKSHSKNKTFTIEKLNINTFAKDNNNDIINVDEFKVINPQLNPKISSEKPYINIINKLTEIFDEKNLSNDYKKTIIKYFLSFSDFLGRKRKKNGNNILKSLEQNKSMNSNINKINLTDVYSFVNKEFKTYKLETKNYILSKMKKYVNLLNEEKNLNYKKKISFHKKLKPNTVLSENELIEVTNAFKNNNDIENLIIFYLLYYSGLSYNSISRIIPNNFKMNFSVLKISKGKVKKINIPSIIQTNLLIFNGQRKNLSQYYFYDFIKENKTISRTQFIKYNFSQIFKLSKSNFDKKKEILLDFSKSRKYKILSKKNYYLFDMDHLKNNNEFSLESFVSIESNDNNQILSLKEDKNSFEKSENMNKFSNEKNGLKKRMKNMIIYY